MEVDQFYLVLPSNSSMKYFPDNTTTRFTTQLPHEIRLHGRWGVALTEIQFPRTFLHVQNKNSGKIENRIGLMSFVPGLGQTQLNYGTGYTIDGENLLQRYSLRYLYDTDIKLYQKIATNASGFPHQLLIQGVWEQPITENFDSGVDKGVKDLVAAINETSIARKHVKLVFKGVEDCYVRAERICEERKCDVAGAHFLAVSEKVSNILGFAPHKLIPVPSKDSNHPVSLARGLPEKMFIYCDICEPRITGDVQTPLLRIVPVDIRNYVFASTQVTQLGSPNYIPLIRSEFRTIEIDIRDHAGVPIPFEFGTLTVTLHFKKLD